MSIRFIDEDLESKENPSMNRSRIRFLEETPVNSEYQKPIESTGIIQSAKNLITGSDRMTPDIEGLSDIGSLPELQNITLAGLKSALTTLTGNDEESAAALKANFPGIKIRKDERGNLIATSAIDNQDYVINKPGLDIRDAIKFGLTAAMFSPTGKIAGLGARALGAAATQAAIEGTQSATGGDFDTGQILGAGATEAIFPGLAKGVGKAIVSGPNMMKALRGKLPVSAAQKAVNEAEDIGIDVLTTDIRPPKTFAGKLAQATTERIPIAGTGPIRSVQAEGRLKSVRDFISKYGGDDYSNLSDDIFRELEKRRGGVLKKYVDLKRGVIDRLDEFGTVDMSKTVGAIDQEISKLKSSKLSDIKPVINLLEDYRNSIEDQNISNIEFIRQQLGQKFKDPSFAHLKTSMDKSVNKIYGAMKSDIGDFIKKNGDRRDYVKWRIADKKLSEMTDELKSSSLKMALKKGDIESEKAMNMIFSNSPSQINLLYKNLSKDGKEKAKVAIIQKVVEKSGGIDNLTPDTFLREMRKVENSTRVFFNKEDKKVLSGLVNALKLTRRAPDAALKPPTGVEMTAFTLPTMSAWLLGSGPLAGLGATGAVGSIARVYESKPIRNILLQLDNAKPSKKTDKLLNDLSRILTTNIQAARQERQKGDNK